MLLEIREVRKSFDSITAVNNVSLQLQAGEMVSIQGPSGCGKSTLLLLAGGLLHPDTGTIQVQGSDLYQLSPEARAQHRALHIGYVFQQFHLIPYLTVRENILAAALAANSPGSDETSQHRTRELLGQFGLESRADHRASELSSGERQRTALARALLNRPAIVLADEPTGNLDPENARIVLDGLKSYAATGHGILLVTHSPPAATTAHRHLHMQSGQFLPE